MVEAAELSWRHAAEAGGSSLFPGMNNGDDNEQKSMSSEYTESGSGISVVSKIEEAWDNWDDLSYLRDVILYEPFGSPIKYKNGKSHTN